MGRSPAPGLALCLGERRSGQSVVGGRRPQSARGIGVNLVNQPGSRLPHRDELFAAPRLPRHAARCLRGPGLRGQFSRSMRCSLSRTLVEQIVKLNNVNDPARPVTAGYAGAVDLRISTPETSCRSAVACSYTRASRQFHAPGLRPAPNGSCARSGSARSGSRMRRGKLDARGGFDRHQVSWATRSRLGACGCFCRMREYRNSRHGRYQTVFECAGKLCRRELGVLQST